MDKLPIEILHLILRPFRPEPSPVDAFGMPLVERWRNNKAIRMNSLPESQSQYFRVLRNLCLVNRRMRDIYQPILYQHLILLKGSEAIHARRSFERGQVTRIVQRLAGNKQLAAQVDQLTLTLEFIETLTQKEETVEFLMETARHIAPDFESKLADGAPPQTRGKFSIRRCIANKQKNARFSVAGTALAAILIAHLPNLRTLFAPELELPAACLYTPMLNALGIKKLSLKVLTTEMDFIQIASFLQSTPDLEELNIDNLILPTVDGITRFYEPDATCREIFPELPNLKTLRLGRALIHKPWLELILSRCTGGLATFVYEQTRSSPKYMMSSLHGFNPDVPDDEMIDFNLPIQYTQLWDLSKMMNVLASHKYSLKQIRADLGIWENHSQGALDLERFFQLEDIWIPDIDFFAHDQLVLLPPSIQTLRLVFHSQYEMGQVDEMLKKLSNRLKDGLRLKLPRLRLVETNAPLMDPQAIVAEFAQSDVALVADPEGTVGKAMRYKSRVSVPVDPRKLPFDPLLPDEDSDDEL